MQKEAVILSGIGVSGVSLLEHGSLGTILRSAMQAPTRIECLLIDNTTRLSREPACRESVFALLKDAGVILECVDQNLELSDADPRRQLIGDVGAAADDNNIKVNDTSEECEPKPKG